MTFHGIILPISGEVSRCQCIYTVYVVIIPGVNIDQKEKSLHGDDVNPLAVKPGHFQHLQVGETQDEQRKHKTGGVENYGEDRELDPVAALLARLQGAGGVDVAVVHPGKE